MAEETTIIYYTSNRENPKFERKVQQVLMKAAGDLPIVSVSQKPIDFGKNICVGDIGATAENMLRQIREGAKAATTKFIVQAEADCLYHKSYFEFVPEREDVIYRPDSFYILWPNKSRYYYPKYRGDLSGFSARDHIINVINRLLSESFDHLNNAVRKYTKHIRFHNEIPAVSFKTKAGMHYGCPVFKTKKTNSLPHWGNSSELAKKYI